MAEKGKLIVFEGGDGSGKTKHIEALKTALETRDFQVRTTREPGGTPLGKIIRTILFDKQNELSPEEEIFLFFTDRSYHLRRVVSPSLEKGMFILQDRSYFSTWAYQIRGSQLGEEHQDLFYVLLERVVGNLRPDFVFLLDIDPEKGLLRTRGRGEQPTAFEQKDLDYHHRVREGLKEIVQSQMDEHECAIIDTSRPFEEVHGEIKSVLAERLGINL